RARATPALPSFPTRRSSDLCLHSNQNLVFAKLGLSDILVLQDLRPAELVEACGFHFEGISRVRNYKCSSRFSVLRKALRARFALDRKSTRLNSSHLGISYAV